jgi:hypothetical protein
VAKAGGRLEIYLVDVRYRNEALIEVIPIVLGTNHFVVWHFVLVAHVAPLSSTDLAAAYRGPRSKGLL